MAWGKAGSTTLSSAGDNIDSGTITASKINQILSHEIASGNTTAQFTFNGSTGSEYASRWSNNGGSENVYGTQSSFDGYLSSSTAYDIFNLIFNSSIVGEEKLSMMYTVDSGGSGAGNAPQRAQLVSKYVPSSLSTTITKIECDNTGSGSFDTNSNISVLGSDITPASAITFPSNVQEGSRAEITDTRKMYYKFDANAYHSEVWYEAGTVPYAGGRGVFGGGNTSGNTMDYITIATPSNATDFGDLTVSRLYIDAVSSLTRGVIGGGWNGSANEDTMDYITFSTPSNATDFGNLTVARHALAGVSSGTRGVFGGFGGALTNVIDYITIATEGNATDFGDLTVARQDLAGVSSDTRGVFAGGDNKNQMDYITISTTGNATDFGDLLTTLRYPAGVSNGIRGVFAGGDPNSGQGNTDVIQYITIATTGNSTDFGDLIVGRHAPAGVNSDTRGVIGGGYSGGNSNVMEYITIATTGNATDFGDLTVARNHLAGASRF